MGYWIVTKKVNIKLNESQQAQIYNYWTDISEDEPVKQLATQYKYYKLLTYKNKFVKENLANLQEILEHLGFTVEKTKKGIKLKSMEAKIDYQSVLFEPIASVIDPGSYITFRGEDGAIFGWFFNQKLIHYSNYKELKELRKPFELYKEFDKKIEDKPISNKMSRIKV